MSVNYSITLNGLNKAQDKKMTAPQVLVFALNELRLNSPKTGYTVP